MVKSSNSQTVKRNAINMTNNAFSEGEVVTITLIGGNRNTAKIIGRSRKTKKVPIIVSV